MRERPIDYCYWITNHLLAGEYPRNVDEESSEKKIEALLKSGVSVFIDLTEVDESGPGVEGSHLLPYAGLAESAEHLRFAMPDGRLPESRKFTKEILDAIDQKISEGNTVYVHCLRGTGRTTTVVGCWLSRNGYSGVRATRRIRELWKQNPKSLSRVVPENEREADYIRDWREPA